MLLTFWQLVWGVALGILLFVVIIALVAIIFMTIKGFVNASREIRNLNDGDDEDGARVIAIKVSKDKGPNGKRKVVVNGDQQKADEELARLTEILKSISDSKSDKEDD